MALKWYEQIPIISSKATAVYGKAKSAWDYLKDQKSFQEELEAEQRKREQEKKQAMIQSMTEYRQRQKVTAYAEERGVEMTPADIEKGIESRQNLYTVIDETVREAAQKRYDKEREDEAKERAKVIGQLQTQGLINYDMTPEEAEPFIQQALYEARAKTALQAEDWEKAREYQQQADSWFQKLYPEEAKPKAKWHEGLKPKLGKPSPEGFKATEPWRPTGVKPTMPEGQIPKAFEVLPHLASIVEKAFYPFTATFIFCWSQEKNMKRLNEISEKYTDPATGNLTEEGKGEYAKWVKSQYPEAPSIEKMKEWLPDGAKYEEFKQLPWYQQVVYEAPAWIAVMAYVPSAMVTRAKLASTAAKPGVVGAAAKVARGALAPVAGYEYAVGKAITLPIKGASAVTNKVVTSYVNKNARYISSIVRRPAKTPIEGLLQKVFAYHGRYISMKADVVLKARGVSEAAKVAGKMAEKTAAQKELLFLESGIRNSTKTMDNIVSAVKAGKELTPESLIALIAKNTPDDFAKGIGDIIAGKVGVEAVKPVTLEVTIPKAEAGIVPELKPIKGEQAGMLGVPGKVVEQKKPYTMGQETIEDFAKLEAATGKNKIERATSQAEIDIQDAVREGKKPQDALDYAKDEMETLEKEFMERTFPSRTKVKWQAKPAQEYPYYGISSKELEARYQVFRDFSEGLAFKMEEAVDIGITPKVLEMAGTRPDGGRAWELYTKLFDVEDTKSTIQRLYPGGLEKRLAEVMGKIPLVGKGTVRRVNPFVTPRETIEAQKVQELLAVAADRRIRRSQGIKAVVEDLVRSVIPGADSIKLFQIDERGIQHAFKPKAGFEKAANGVVDVLEHPQKWQLNEPALKVSQIWNNIRESAVKELERRGIHVNKAFYEEGAGYFPRMVIGGHGEELKFPRVRFDKPRHYATQLEAMDNSITYAKDPIENILSFIDHFHSLIAYNELTTAVKLVGRTPKDAIPLTKIIAREQAAKELRGLTHAQNALRRMKRGERLPEITLKTIERNVEAFGKRTRAAMALAGEERVDAASKLLGELKTSIPRAKLDSFKARADYKKALEMARSPKLGEFERGTKHPVFRGRIFPEEVAKVLDEFAETGTSGFMKATQSVAQTLRTLVAALDFSPMFIQGTPMLGRFPAKWAMTTLRAFKAMVSPAYAHKWMAKDENVGIRTRTPDLISGGLHEYYAGMVGIKKIPVIGKPLGKIYKPFEQFFSFWGNAARVEIAKALEPAFVKAGQVNQLGTYVNRMTGVMESRALGISSTQRAAETSWVFFAPRYTRSSMAYIGDMFKGGVAGNEARRTLGQLAAGGMLTYLAVCAATGQEPKINPNYPTTMTIKVGNRHIGIGGFYYSLLRLCADVAASVTETGGAERLDFVKISRKDNPFLKFLYNRTSPLTGLVTEALQQKDYLGYPFESPEDWAQWLFVEHMMPIALQAQFPAKYTEEPTERGALLGAEMAGLRTFPVEPFYDLADKYAQQVFGVKWNELWQPTKAGTYRMSAKQNLLLKRFPDLAKAYEPYHERQSVRWKAEHGMTSDKDIALDAFAQERFRKNFNDLTETQKNFIKRLYEQAKS